MAKEGFIKKADKFLKGLKIEKFHDQNRYFIPLIFVSVILMLTGIFYLGPIVITSDVVFEHPLLLREEAVIQAVTLRPGWDFNIEVESNKNINMSLLNLGGEVVASSNNNYLEYSPEFLDLYFVKISSVDYYYSLLDFDFQRSGFAPYPTPYLFFGFGLLLLLGTLIYYLLEPWDLKTKRRLDSVDAVFYPLVFLLSSMVFWVFRDALIWFIPRSYGNILLLIVVSLIIIIAGTLILSAFAQGKKLFMKSKKYKDFFEALTGYFIAFSAVFLTVILDYMGVSNYSGLFLRFGILAYLLFLFIKFKARTAIVIYSLTWATSLVINVLAYSIGIPVIFDTFLTQPSTQGMMPLFIAIEFFVVLGVYFLIKGYYAKKISVSARYGLYASVCFQAFLQVFSGTSLI